MPLSTLRAANDITGADDLANPTVSQRFYRILQLNEAAGDREAPTVRYVRVEPATTPAGAPGLRVKFQATDNVGVTSVTVREGGRVVGQAVPADGSIWVLVLPANYGGFQPRLFTATARDPSGNQGESAPGGVLTANPEQFVPLDANGIPVEGRFLSAITTNQVRPFIFRPGGRPRPGAAPDFFLAFPDGATIRETVAGTLVEFARVSAAFGAESPLQLTAPLVRTGGPVKQLTAGPLAFDALMGVFEQPSAEGLPVTWFGQLPLRWRGGAIDDRGLPGAQFRLDSPDLPTPGWSASFPGALVEFARDRRLRLPLAGDFLLPDGSTNAPRLRVSAGDPLWLTLGADGRISLGGGVELAWPNGQNVRATLRLDDPEYHLTLETSGLRVQAANSLVDLLPANPAGCLSSQTTPAQMAQATECLKSFARAYGHFSALVAASASNAPPSGAEPPGSLNAIGAALEAWGFSATAGVAPALPLDAIAELAAQFGRQAAAAPQMPELLAYRLALTRVRAQVQAGAFTGSAGALAQLEAAMAEADAAARERARSFDAVSNLSAMKQTARLLVEIEALRQLAGLPPSPLLAELPGLFQRFADRLADQWGIVASVFSPAANPTINQLNRFSAIETLRDAIDVQANAQLLGINLNGTRLDELIAQLGLRLLAAVNAALDTAEAARELPAFALAAQDFVELSAWAQAGMFPQVPALASVGESTALANLGDRINTLAQFELDRPFAEKTLGRHTHEIRALLQVLREIPGTLHFAAPPFQRSYDALETQLNLAVNATSLAATTNLFSLLELLEAGTLHREFGARFNLSQPVNWETARLTVVVQRLSAVALAQRGWRELDQAVHLMLNAADRAGLAVDPNLRRACLEQAAALLDTSRSVARAMMRDASGLLRTLDLALPGDIFIDQPAGSIRYNRESQALHGAVRGQLRLPKFALSLTVPNASLDNDGRFDILAYGQLRFNGGVLAVPNRQPLHLWNRGDRGLAFEGGARLSLSNGLRFDTTVSLADPRYAFSLSARGLELDLGRQLVLHRPVLAPAALDRFGSAARDAFGDYFLHLNGAFETLVNATGSFPPVDESGFGRPPEPDVSGYVFDFSTLNAWSAGIIANTRGGLSNAVQSLNPVIESVDRLNQDARAATNALAHEISNLAILAARLQLKGQLQTAAGFAADRQLAGVAELTRFNQAMIQGAQADAELVLALLTPDLADRLGDALDMVRLLYQTEANFQGLGVSSGNPAALPSDPCAAYTQVAASLSQRAEALAVCAARGQAARFGLDPLTGAVVDRSRFLSLTEFELARATRLLLALDALLQEQGTASQGQLMALTSPLLLRQHELLVSEFSATPGPSLERTLELSRVLMENLGAMQLAGVTDTNLASAMSLMEGRLGAAMARVSAADLDRAKQTVDPRRPAPSSRAADRRRSRPGNGPPHPGDCSGRRVRAGLPDAIEPLLQGPGPAGASRYSDQRGCLRALQGSGTSGPAVYRRVSHQSTRRGARPVERGGRTHRLGRVPVDQRFQRPDQLTAYPLRPDAGSHGCRRKPEGLVGDRPLPGRATPAHRHLRRQFGRGFE